MSNQQHTPGPWEAIGNLVRSPMHKEGGCGAMIAECADRWFQKVNSEEAKANATLMSAAPDLLASCQSLIDWCDKNPPAGDALYFVQQAREAIAKATGN